MPTEYTGQEVYINPQQLTDLVVLQVSVVILLIVVWVIVKMLDYRKPRS